MVEKALTFYRKYLKNKPFGWSGDYTSWQHAQKSCVGYNADNILQKVRDATLMVKNGEAVYERDSVIFNTIEYSYPLLAALLWVAAKNEGKLNVIDFGGSLGSTYFQNKRFLDSLKEVQWNIVEQANYVKCGQELIQDKTLKFYHTIEEVISKFKTDILVISGTIQYIEDPYSLIQRLIPCNMPYIIVDNTPFNFENRDRLTVQKVPPSIYSASYPCWFLNYKKVIQAFNTKYNIVTEHLNDAIIELGGKRIRYKGFLIELKNNL